MEQPQPLVRFFHPEDDPGRAAKAEEARRRREGIDTVEWRFGPETAEGTTDEQENPPDSETE